MFLSQPDDRFDDSKTYIISGDSSGSLLFVKVPVSKCQHTKGSNDRDM